MSAETWAYELEVTNLQRTDSPVFGRDQVLVTAERLDVGQLQFVVPLRACPHVGQKITVEVEW